MSLPKIGARRLLLLFLITRDRDYSFAVGVIKNKTRIFRCAAKSVKHRKFAFPPRSKGERQKVHFRGGAHYPRSPAGSTKLRSRTDARTISSPPPPPRLSPVDVLIFFLPGREIESNLLPLARKRISDLLFGKLREVAITRSNGVSVEVGNEKTLIRRD